MRMTTRDASSLDAAAPNLEARRTYVSLPSAGFRVCRAGNLRCAIGLFITHRAEPSWT